MTLADVFGFTTEDLKANRRGQFSAGQQQQMDSIVRQTRRNIFTDGATYIGGGLIALVSIQILLGPALATIFSLLLVVLMIVLVVYYGMALHRLGRLRGTLGVRSVSGTLEACDVDGEHVKLTVGDMPLIAQPGDVQAAYDMLEEGAHYTVYYMGAPPAASVLSMQQHGGEGARSA